MVIALFGATGQLGSLVVDALLERGTPAAEMLALGRDAGRLEALGERGLLTRRVDLDEAATLEAALDRVQDVLLISTSEPGRRLSQHRTAIEAAQAAGARRLVYTSVAKADTTPLVLAPEHRATEQLLAASGLAITVLRNNWYTENHRGEFDRAAGSGVIANSVGDGAGIASAPRADYAEAAAVVLTTPGHEGRTYELSGDVAWTWPEFAAAASRVLGREVVYRAVSAEEELHVFRAAGMPDGTAEFVAAMQAGIRDGALADAAPDLRGLLGRPTQPIEATMRGWVG